jgi:uncharacterized membrane protein YkvA (DUF1232 family)
VARDVRCTTSTRSRGVGRRRLGFSSAEVDSFLPVGDLATVFQRIRQYVRAFKRELQVYQRVLSHPRCPRFSRWCLGGAIAYLLLPFDLIPDWIPVLGQLDDLVIVPFLIWLGLSRLPAGLLAEIRAEME